MLESNVDKSKYEISQIPTTFENVFNIKPNVDNENISANYENGLLILK